MFYQNTSLSGELLFVIDRKQLYAAKEKTFNAIRNS